MHDDIPHIPVSHFYAAMAYYYANKEAIDAYLAEEEAESQRLYEEWLKENPDRPANRHRVS